MQIKRIDENLCWDKLGRKFKPAIGFQGEDGEMSRSCLNQGGPAFPRSLSLGLGQQLHGDLMGSRREQNSQFAHGGAI